MHYHSRCTFAHRLADVRIGAMRHQDRYSSGLFSRYIGQHICTDAANLILDYYDKEVRARIDPPPWAHCFAWYQRRWPMDFRMDLGLFGVYKDYKTWVAAESYDHVRGRWHYRYHWFDRDLEAGLDRRLAYHNMLMIQSAALAGCGFMAALRTDAVDEVVQAESLDGDCYAEAYMLAGFQEDPMVAPHRRTCAQLISHPLCFRVPVEDPPDEPEQVVYPNDVAMPIVAPVKSKYNKVSKKAA